MIEFDGQIREHWKDESFYRLLQPLNKGINSLDAGEFFYGMCLYPKLLQPSGATNLSMIENVTFCMQVEDDIVRLMRKNGVTIKVTMWSCSYNIFATIGGIAGLRFYGR